MLQSKMRFTASALFLLTLIASPLHSQSSEPDPTTLHVYANLVQVPVLVLSDSHRALPPIEPSRFRISLNAGRPFQLTHVRPEGDDPINLAVLIDQTDTDPGVLSHFDEAIASLVPDSLRPQDTVTFFSLNCTLTRARPVSPPNSQDLQAGAFAAMHATHPLSGSHERCAQPVHVWRALAYIIRELATLPGRRVLLTVTSGRDADSSIGRVQLAELATSSSVSLFALSTHGEPTSLHEYYLTDICELSGGMVLYPKARDLSASLKQFITLLRGRYIISFPLPSLRQAGIVNMEVKIAKLHGFIRPGGVGIPLPDPAIAADPNTFLPDPTKAPELGNRRSLPPPR